ncbi:MAG TPA: nicotinate phosphoribosyltransferase [Candidatus Binatia bacterium]|nr:nicotinate phosphoribosyltransferase [Candidatus Binatia bacterium]
MTTSDNLALLTDLYQLTMAQSYFRERKSGLASFSLFIRSYPPERGYFIAAGLRDVIEYLESFCFDAAALDYLSSLNLFTDDFLHFLSGLRFTGDLWALPEGRVFFIEEPILEVTAPIIEAQVVETFIINQVNFQSLIATKAARCVDAAAGRSVVDFALRRTQGSDAGMKVARATFIAGFVGTSNVRGAKLYGIPPIGTMAHSFVSTFGSEIEAFRAYARAFPKSATLLIDTFDTAQGARLAAQVAKEMAGRGEQLRGVRIDSGDLASLAREVRLILDEAGLKDVRIIGSGGLDEYDLARFSAAHVPFDSYGVGTKVGVSADAPWADTAYKLVEYDTRPVLKLSTGKESWPGKKQVFRLKDDEGFMTEDVITLRNEQISGAKPLLEPVLQSGRTVARLPTLEETKTLCRENLHQLPEKYRKIMGPAHYPVRFSSALRALRKATEKNLAIKAD